MADLGRGVREHFGVGAGGGPGHEAGMAEEVGRAPQQADAGLFHVTGHGVDHLVEIGAALLERGALGCHITVVEAEERCPQLLEELEGDVHLVVGRGHGIEPRLVPRTGERALTEHVAARPHEAVPVADRHAEVILHAPAQDLPLGVVPAEGQRVVTVGPGVADQLDVGEVLVGHATTVGQEVGPHVRPTGATPGSAACVRSHDGIGDRGSRGWSTGVGTVGDIVDRTVRPRCRLGRPLAPGPGRSRPRVPADRPPAGPGRPAAGGRNASAARPKDGSPSTSGWARARSTRSACSGRSASRATTSATVFKNLQLDIGAPHQFMDFQFRLDGPRLRRVLAGPTAARCSTWSRSARARAAHVPRHRGSDLRRDRGRDQPPHEDAADPPPAARARRPLPPLPLDGLHRRGRHRDRPAPDLDVVASSLVAAVGLVSPTAASAPSPAAGPTTRAPSIPTSSSRTSPIGRC